MKKTLKRCLFTCWNRRAFTLLETVVALFIVGLTSLLILASVQTVKVYRAHELNSQKLAWYQFCTQLENQLTQEYIEQVEDSRLMTRQNKTLFYYEMYHNMLRRTSDQGGHEPLLLHVSSWQLVQYDHYILMHVQLENGEEYAHTLYIRKKLKKE